MEESRGRRDGIQVCREVFLGGEPEGNGALLVSLAAYDQISLRQMQVSNFRGHDLIKPQSRIYHKRENHPVTQVDHVRVIAVHGKNSLEFLIGKDVDERLASLWKSKFTAKIGLYVIVYVEPIKIGAE